MNTVLTQEMERFNKYAAHVPFMCQYHLTLFTFQCLHHVCVFCVIKQVGADRALESGEPAEGDQGLGRDERRAGGACG